MKRLVVSLRNMPRTHMERGIRTRHSSSRREMSNRWCRPLSMAQASRLCVALLFNIVAYRRLVVFDGEEIVSTVIDDQLAGGLGLGVQGVQRHGAAGQVQLAEELSGHGDLIGLLVDQVTAQVVLAG